MEGETGSGGTGRNALRDASEFACVPFFIVAAGHTSDPFDTVQLLNPNARSP